MYVCIILVAHSLSANILLFYYIGNGDEAAGEEAEREEYVGRNDLEKERRKGEK